MSLFTFGEEIIRLGHSFELEVIAAWVAEEHGVLLPRRPLEPQLRAYHELHVVLEAFSERLEVLDGENDSLTHSER